GAGQHVHRVKGLDRPAPGNRNGHLRAPAGGNPDHLGGEAAQMPDWYEDHKFMILDSLTFRRGTDPLKHDSRMRTGGLGTKTCAKSKTCGVSGESSFRRHIVHPMRTAEPASAPRRSPT